jgi:hypothetical protein
MERINPELQLLLREIKAEMHRMADVWDIIRNDIQGHLKTSKDAGESQEKKQKPVSPVVVQIQADPTATAKKETSEQQKARRERIQLFITGITLAVVFAYTLVACNQWIEMQKATEAATEAARAAEYVIRINQANFQRDQRPYILAQKPWRLPIVPGQPIRLNVYWANFGKSPALDDSGRGEIFFGKNAMRDAYRWFDVQDKESILRFGSVVPPGLVPDVEKGVEPRSGPGGFSTFVSKKIPSAEDVAFIKAHDLSVFVVSREQYFDAWGTRYWTDTCFAYLVSGANVKCPNHNQIH